MDGLFDCATGRYIKKAPPRTAPVTEVTPHTTAMSRSRRLEKNWKSAETVVPRRPANKAPASPAMPADPAKRPTRIQRRSSPSVPQAA
jgi:hypothetical protein